ncbi:unnamed protein product [marine sediment metagenome]|uniref:Uncharacterized protein n=1 Tax=marine sediment metagenome TaxID=412755 RepID=X1D3R0_9ZZZZ
MPIPVNRYFKWEFMIRFGSLGNTVQPVEFEINIEEASQNTGTGFTMAYIPSDGTWTYLSPDKSSWPQFTAYNLNVNQWYKMSVTVDLNVQPIEDFVFEINDVEVARIPALNSGVQAYYMDLLTIGTHIASQDGDVHYFHLDEVKLYEYT